MGSSDFVATISPREVARLRDLFLIKLCVIPESSEEQLASSTFRGTVTQRGARTRFSLLLAGSWALLKAFQATPAIGGTQRKALN